ncbi:unnamed protein product [Lathyrus sativus]|nr:unnamed protein product [Lathyrus sativus]
MRFNHLNAHWNRALNLVAADASLISNHSNKVSKSFIHDLVIINKFNVLIHPPPAPKIIDVIWHPPSRGWIKCNSDRSFSSILASYSGLFRDFNVDFLHEFDENVHCNSSLQAELWGVIRAIEIANAHHWN